MIPTMTGIDHVHVYVSNREAAAQWYQDVLGFKVVEKLLMWAGEGGPLTLQDISGNVHLALFEADKEPDTTIAFGATGAEFVSWKQHLESQGIQLRITDHQLAWSLYFHDPDENMHVSQQLSQ